MAETSASAEIETGLVWMLWSASEHPNRRGAGYSKPRCGTLPVELLDSLGVQRSRKAVHDWVQKVDLQADAGKSPNQIALDETVIRINDQQFWLYAAANPQSNELLHVRLFAATTTTLTEIFLHELRHKHAVETAVFLVDGVKHLQTALQRTGLRFQMSRHGNRNAVERIFRELKR